MTILLIILVTHLVQGQTIRSISPIDPKAKIILKEIMQKAGVKSLTISSTNRLASNQVKTMYHYIKKNGVQEQYKLYGPEGDAVIQKYEEGLKLNKNEIEIHKMMLDELNKQLPSAIKNNRLMHVGREKEYIVIDVDENSINPNIKKNEFEKMLRESGKCFRVLGQVQGEKNCIHIEIAR